MKTVKSLTVRGRRWRVVDSEKHKGPELGYCTHPEFGKELAIPLDGDTESELDTIIHECIHACHWDMAEEAVDETAASIAHVLWRLGWRKD